LAKFGKKIMIIGSGGSGKSTLAIKLGEILALPVIHLDKEFWKNDWIKVLKAEWYEKQKKLVSAQEWIVDGNYTGSLEVRLKAADTVIFLDFGRFTCMRSIIKRRFSKNQAEINTGNPVKLNRSFVKWVWQFNSKTRPNIIEKLLEYKDIKIVILKNRKDMKKFIEELL